MQKYVSVSRQALALLLAIGGSFVDTDTGFAQVSNTSSDVTPEDNSDGIVVTGSRVTGITAAESAAPIKVLSEAAMEHVGQPALNQVLTQLVPSFTAQAYGGDTANLTLSARLRGLSPNHALVLVNGKRRHGTANLAILSGPFQGAASPDLDLISPASIQRLEVLEDGAAAQYGSDAIAGVINIILKDNNEGVDGSITAGQYYKSDGETLAASLHIGTRLGENGFLNTTLFHRFHNFSQVGGIDRRVTNQDGSLKSNYSSDPQLQAATAAAYQRLANFPYVNPYNGDARQSLTNGQFNAGYDIGDVQLYSFGTYSRRIGESRANVRVPDRIIAGQTLGTTATLITPGALIFAPNGFVPRILIREDDFSVTGGMKGKLAGFNFDLSTTYGSDTAKVSTTHTANRSLFIDTHFTPTEFYDGLFKATEWTTNLDVTRAVDVGLAEPLNVAFGAEYRRNTYAIGAGDAGSTYKEGPQAYPGFRNSDAGFHDRSNQSLYLDVSVKPLSELTLDGAVRYEHYSDFGSKTILKGTGRYDFSPSFALRGTVSTGFRAPTLAESYYSATNVSPTSAFVQLPANSAAAKLLGFGNLKPERSTNLSIGTVLRPANRLTITLDAYQIRVNDRILGTGSIFGSGGSTNFPIVTQAIVANGNVLDPTVTQTGVNIFTNGADTRTRGVDLTVSYITDLGGGKINWTLAANYNQTKITSIDLAPATLTPAGSSIPISLFDATTISNLERASPRIKIVGSGIYTNGPVTVSLRETLYGRSSQDLSPDGGTFYRQTLNTAAITDLEVSYSLSEAIQFSLGANNLFDKRPNTLQILPNGTIVDGNNVYDGPLTFSPYGINGGYYYARINFHF